MEKLSTPLQTWYNHHIDLLELNQLTEKINKLVTEVIAKQTYTEAELDEIVENRKKNMLIIMLLKAKRNSWLIWEKG